MALVKLSGGPLDGQEKTIQDPDTMGTELPGYSPVEQVSDPEKGQLLRAEWGGDPAAASYYPDNDNESTGSDKRDAKDRVGDAKQRGGKGGDAHNQQNM